MDNQEILDGAYRELIDEAIECVSSDAWGRESIDKIVKYAFTYSHLGVVAFRPIQVPSELREFLNLVKARKCKRIMEVGTGVGGLFFCLCCVADDGGEVYTVDLPEHGGGGPEIKDKLYESFGFGRVKAVPIRANCYSTDGIREIKRVVGEEPLDLLFIDAKHENVFVTSDYVNFSPMVRPGGLIGFHDVTFQGVKTLWDELKKRHKYHEFIAAPNVEGNGIGVIEKNGD